MTKDELARMVATLNHVDVDPGRAAALLAVVDAVNAAVRAGADAHLAMDSTPWSFDTFKVQTLEAEAEARS